MPTQSAVFSVQRSHNAGERLLLKAANLIQKLFRRECLLAKKVIYSTEFINNIKMFYVRGVVPRSNDFFKIIKL